MFSPPFHFYALVENLSQFHSIVTSISVKTCQNILVAYAKLHKFLYRVPHTLDFFGFKTHCDCVNQTTFILLIAHSGLYKKIKHVGLDCPIKNK